MNSLRLSALLMLYSTIVWIGAETTYEIFALILAMLVLWVGFIFKNSAVSNFFEPMLLPSCLIGSAITGFSAFRFAPSVQNESIAAIFLLALAGAFVFAIFRLFALPRGAGRGSGIN